MSLYPVLFSFFLVDQIYHLASPASPPHYMYNPIKVGLGYAVAMNAIKFNTTMYLDDENGN